MARASTIFSAVLVSASGLKVVTSKPTCSARTTALSTLTSTTALKQRRVLFSSVTCSTPPSVHPVPRQCTQQTSRALLLNHPALPPSSWKSLAPSREPSRASGPRLQLRLRQVLRPRRLKTRTRTSRSQRRVCHRPPRDLAQRVALTGHLVLLAQRSIRWMHLRCHLAPRPLSRHPLRLRPL